MQPGEIWIPLRRGCSSLVRGGKSGARPGPLRFRLKTPALGRSEKARVVFGRLSIYCANNLIQSAVLRLTVARSGSTKTSIQNNVDIDFSLTDGFRAITQQFERRTLNSSTTGEPVTPDVGLNITTNTDGNGGHRIAVRVAKADVKTLLPVAWRPYDPLAGGKVLEAARTELLMCFFQKDIRTGRTDMTTSSLRPDNSKDFDQFRHDLMRLARFGNILFTSIIQSVQAFSEDGSPMLARHWTNLVVQALRNRRIIQIARVHAANYILPWALAYTYPLPEAETDAKFCEVLLEWKNGRRDAPFSGRCPYEESPWHQSNVYCPYGFWGLKHLIEQPLLASNDVDGSFIIREARRVFGFSLPLKIGVAYTKDLEQAMVDSHLKNLEMVGQVTVAEQALDRTKVRQMLPKADLAYFLCHCEKEKQFWQFEIPFIGIGDRDDDSQHKIYPNTITDWSREEPLNQNPLIFINGCHSGDLGPGNVLDFVSAFAFAGASGVIGTEVVVRPHLATEVAERFFRKMGSGASVGLAMLETRWELANKGNLLGLAYTPYGMVDLALYGGSPKVQPQAAAASVGGGMKALSAGGGR